MLAFSNDYYGIIFRATQSVELFCAYHISTFTELKDGSLQGLLGGYASDGSSTDAVLQSQYMYRGVSVLEELMSPQFWNLIGQALEVVEQLNSNDNSCVYLIGTDGNRFVLIE